MDTESPQPIYVGHSWFLHRVPQLMVLLAAGLFAFDSVGAGLLFGIPGLVAGLGLPWRFAVYGDGLDLWFSLGRRRVLARDDVTVRVEWDAAVVFPRGRLRVGYPLTDGIVTRDRPALRNALQLCGFEIVR
jgi:hypothetical protein